jgi:hypothetical protein
LVPTSGPHYCEPEVFQIFSICCGNPADECRRRNHLSLLSDMSQVANTGRRSVTFMTQKRANKLLASELFKTVSVKDGDSDANSGKPLEGTWDNSAKDNPSNDL